MGVAGVVLPLRGVLRPRSEHGLGVPAQCLPRCLEACAANIKAQPSRHYGCRDLGSAQRSGDTQLFLSLALRDGLRLKLKWLTLYLFQSSAHLWSPLSSWSSSPFSIAHFRLHFSFRRRNLACPFSASLSPSLSSSSSSTPFSSSSTFHAVLVLVLGVDLVVDLLRRHSTDVINTMTSSKHVELSIEKGF